MFNQLPTSKAISLKFTFYVIGIIGFFAVAANILFFHQRYRTENTKLHVPEAFPTMLRIEKPGGHQSRSFTKFIRSPVETIPATAELITVIRSGRITRNIARIDNEYIIYIIKPHVIKLSVITRLVQAQKAMALITIALLAGLTILTYRLSKLFVRSSLHRLHRLTRFVDTVDLTTLSHPVPLEGPENDEVRKVAYVLQNAFSAIKRQTDSLQEFISNASHELKTPLMQLSSSIDYLTKLNTSDEHTLQNMKKTVRSMNTLIEDLLLLTKLEVSFDPSNLPPINLGSIIREMVSDFQPLFSDAGIELKARIEDTCIQPVVEQHVKSIVRNLVSNALKYTPHGEVSVVLTQTSLIVSDTGIGIAPEDIPFIRDKFRKADKARSQEDSHGLGLHLVKKLVDLYGRTISVHSTVGEGSTFTLLFTPYGHLSTPDGR